MTYNGDCGNCGKHEAVGRCPCGCKLWVCRWCIRAIKRALSGHVLTDAESSDQSRPLRPESSP